MNETKDLIVGIDLSQESTQLAYYDRTQERPRSHPERTGQNDYEIPTLLCRRSDNYSFCVGSEARYFATEKGGALSDNVYLATKSEKDVGVGGALLAPYKILSEYFLGILRLLGLKDPVRDIKCLIITTPELTPVQVGNLSHACEEMGFMRDEFLLQDYGQSFYYYAMTQRRENGNRNIGWIHFRDTFVTFQKLSVQSGSNPILVQLKAMGETQLPDDPAQRDAPLKEFALKNMGEELYSTVLLTGNGFSTDWATASTAALCQQHRKVFYGNNLFVKGAVAAGKDRLEDKKLRSYRFIDDSIILTNVGMDMKIMGAPAYHPLIEAGKNWYEYHISCDFLLDGVKELVFIVSRPGGTEKKKAVMDLPGLPSRPPKTTRLHLEMDYLSHDQCLIQVWDRGFGEMFPTSGKHWQEMLKWET